jgi:hypothetical protein
MVRPLKYRLQNVRFTFTLSTTLKQTRLEDSIMEVSSIHLVRKKCHWLVQEFVSVELYRWKKKKTLCAQKLKMRCAYKSDAAAVHEGEGHVQTYGDWPM